MGRTAVEGRLAGVRAPQLLLTMTAAGQGPIYVGSASRSKLAAERVIGDPMTQDGEAG